MLLLLLLLATIHNTLSCNFTITNIQSFHKATAALANIKTNDDFHICVQNLHTTQPLLLNATHNHPLNGNIVWRSTEINKKPPAIITGGSPLNKWYRCNQDARCPGLEWNDVFVHYTSDIANLSTTELPVRNLWINGSRATRVSVDGNTLGWNVTATGYSTPSTVPSSFVTNQVELLWPRTIRNWIEPRCIVSSVSNNNIIVEPTCWKALIARNNGKLPPIPTFVQNIARPPDSGEFTSTPLYIFYKPLPSTPYQSPVNAFVPISNQIIVATNLTNHIFQNLQISYTTWRIPSSSTGYVPSQTLVTSSGEPKGAFSIASSINITIENVKFCNLGSAYGLSIGQASQNISIRSNTFVDLSGGALKIGNVLNTTNALTTNIKEQDRNYYVFNNIMKSIAVEFKGGAAIFAGYVANTTISQNTVSNTGYTGISLGWGWGTHVTGPQTYAADNHIIGNQLINVMSALNDGGCTYTLGPQPRSTVSNNYCSSDHAPVVGCFYHDNGSRYFTTTNNVCTTSPAPCVYLQGCCNAPAYDIAVSNLWCRNTAPVINGCAKENCTIDSKTLYILKAGEAWPPQAQSIVDRSGSDVSITQ